MLIYLSEKCAKKEGKKEGEPEAMLTAHKGWRLPIPIINYSTIFGQQDEKAVHGNVDSWETNISLLYNQFTILVDGPSIVIK